MFLNFEALMDVEALMAFEDLKFNLNMLQLVISFYIVTNNKQTAGTS